MSAPSLSDLNAELASVSRVFPLQGSFRHGAPYGSGHINDTYVVRFDQDGAPVRYILQRINHRIFKDVPCLMENIRRVTSHLAAKAAADGGADSSRRVLRLIPTRDGCPFHEDGRGAFWRCYLFVEQARTYDLIENPRHAFEAARAFGEFQRLLVDLPDPRLRETIPDFHNTRSRFETLRRVAREDPRGRAASARAELAFAFERESIVDRLLDLQKRGEIPERITHNDTKLNNVLLDDITQEAVCVIDLDTVMPGLALYDFGDMVRSATNSAREDERDLCLVTMRMPIFEALVGGYLASAGSFLVPAERANLVFSGRLITFEIGLRFLTDYLEGDVYFKTRREGQNLDRCRNQFALVHSIEVQESAMQAVVDAAQPAS